MKILYIDESLSGHHISYLLSLEDDNNENVYILPYKFENLKSKQYVVKINLNKLNLINYIKWLYKIIDIARKEKPDIIHFLYGDIFYKFFSLGLNLFKNFKTIVTFHQMRFSLLRDLSRKLICRNFNICIVHTLFLKNYCLSHKIYNVEHIEYPYLGTVTNASLNNGTSQNKEKVLLALGGTRYDKGLDILLNALSEVKEPFHLIIAGKQEHLKKNDITSRTKSYENHVTLILEHLTNNKITELLNISDIIILPYRYCFNGSSGPLTEGVWFRKCIIGPNHGSLNQIIVDNDIGKTFVTENIENLSITISNVLNSEYRWTTKAEEYRESICPNKFKKKYFKFYNNLFKL